MNSIQKCKNFREFREKVLRLSQRKYAALCGKKHADVYLREQGHLPRPWNYRFYLKGCAEVGVMLTEEEFERLVLAHKQQTTPTQETEILESVGHA